MASRCDSPEPKGRLVTIESQLIAKDAEGRISSSRFNENALQVRTQRATNAKHDDVLVYKEHSRTMMRTSDGRVRRAASQRARDRNTPIAFSCDKSIGMSRPPFVISTADVPEESGRYPNSDEPLGHGRPIGRVAGLLKIGLHTVRLAPGHRLSWPHAEEKEEEFAYLLDGEIDAWIDGQLYAMKPGDLAAFPAGTGICHTFLNNGEREALILVGGEASKVNNRIFYPLHPHRRGDMPWSHWWEDAPLRPQGEHDGKPEALRAK